MSHTAWVQPLSLSRDGVRLEPLTPAHAPGLALAAADGQLWTLRVSTVPEPGQEGPYIELALQMQE
ncbi:MAG: GNAT family N-acetyltransferase, partial [Brachymonas sp.]|nr:GNAT family N-acetyltransferase [Brachymonas sp.]